MMTARRHQRSRRSSSSSGKHRLDDGFKGRGAVAKKITALAGLNDGIVSELEAKRHHAVLAATPEVAEMLVDRVDGAMLGRKTIEISVTD